MIISLFHTILIVSYAFLCRLREAGVESPVVAVGSTPSCSKPPDDIEGVTEFHPGNYIFYGTVAKISNTWFLQNKLQFN